MVTKRSGPWLFQYLWLSFKVNFNRHSRTSCKSLYHLYRQKLLTFYLLTALCKISDIDGGYFVCQVGAQGATGFTGPDGFAGATGFSGFTGPQGDFGDTGAPGRQGPQGQKGQPGQLIIFLTLISITAARCVAWHEI